MSAVQKLLRELIALPSVNPAFAGSETRFAGEARMADFLAATAARAGLDVELQPVLPQRSNLLVRLTPTGSIRHRVLLAAHLDTVGSQSLTDALFVPREQHGRLYGRGACDTKGCVASMLTAVMDLARLGPRPAQTEIVFAGLVDEENNQAGSRALAASGFRANLAVVGEPTRLRVVTAHKGDLWLELTTRGRSAHGARPELGRNAVRLMAQVVENIEGDYADQLRTRRHPLLGSPTVNVGKISGGTQANIVPDYCAITLDRRTLPGENQASVVREIKQLLRAAGLAVSFNDLKGVPCLPLETDFRLPWIRQLMRLARQHRPVGVDYFCDASVLAQAGIPSVVFGPGNIDQAHTAREWISLRALAATPRILEQFLHNLP
jgi:succinyl-diaminopimelate desuccinylase